MSNVTPQDIKKLRDMTGAGMMECKAALLEAEGDFDKATEILIKKSAAIAARKAHRSASKGMIASYVHVREDGGVGSLGVLVEVNVETDFAARAPKFKEFVDKLTLHIAAAGPIYLSIDQIPEAVVEKQKEIFVAQMEETKKPKEILEKIAEGKLKKWKSDVCLLDQVYALAQSKEEQIPISEMVQQTIGKIGENIVIRRFARFALGEE
ncbi:MAG: elongation factor Ts [Deltaproteobacteria bacterium]|nr:elongation factor Ts [Deltaproteobacteria bacterium]